MTLGEILEKRVKECPEKTALFFEGKKINYREVNQNVNRLANGLMNLGIGRGDKVAIMLPNIPEFVYSFFAIQKLSAVAVPFNTMYKGGEVLHILKDSNAKAVIALTNFAPLINEIKPELPSLQHIILTGERNLTFADPESNMFVQLVLSQETLPDLDSAYHKVGFLLTNVFKNFGIEDVWYKHRGSIRVRGKKIAGFLFQEIEDTIIVTIVCFLRSFIVDEFLKVIWVPPEIRDKVVEPLTSIEGETGGYPDRTEFKNAVVESIEKVFDVIIKEGKLERDELFGYQKQRSLAHKR
ncbi:AMP-binding protein [candidate division WOR-3 bacterium]|nr:AMP-binding protein [candidate division WOR-3 bacterium]